MSLRLSSLPDRRSRHQARNQARARRRLRLFVLERLDDRTLLSTFTVVNTGDNGGVNPAPGAGTGTLRQAIVDVDADPNPGVDTIAFDIGSGVQTIEPASPLPTITQPVIIDGYTEPGAGPNTMNPESGDNAALMIELSGVNDPTAPGLNISAGNSTVQGLVINQFQTAINITGSGGDHIQGNFLGTDPTGTQTFQPVPTGCRSKPGTPMRCSTQAARSAAEAVSTQPRVPPS